MTRPLALLALLLPLGLLTACAPPSAPPPTGGPTAAPEPPVAPGPAQPSPAAAAAPSQPAGSVSGELTVFAAASLTDAFKEIGTAFEAANPGSKLTFNFGASTQLRTQLEQGARADVFASADQAQLDRARQANAIEGPERLFVRNRLVVIFPRSNPAGLRALIDLSQPGLRFVTAAPEVPIGGYTRTMLETMARDPAFGADFKDRVNANIVSREPNVRQVVAKINLGEADAAVVYASDVTPEVAPNLGRLEVPDRFNTPATYPIAQVRGAPNAAGAEAFIAYVLSPPGQAALQKWGFIPIGLASHRPRPATVS
jgi:molybdate transport system substrate-binding protein